MRESKILFTDLDGTLLASDKTISEENRRAISMALSMGHYVAIATGRPVESGRKVVRDLGLTIPGCYMIAFNGAVIYDCAADRVLMERKLPIESVCRMFEKAHKAGLYIQTYSSREVLTEKHTKELDYYCNNTSMPYKLVPNIVKGIKEEPSKLLLAELEDKSKLEKFQRDNEEWTKDTMLSFFSCDEYLEYCPIGTTKGAGIKYLCQFLDIPIENTIAAGDERNDISMILDAAVGVAVQNANEELKEVADYITVNDNDHHAIAEIIDKYMTGIH